MKISAIPVGMLGTNCYILMSGEKSCAIIDPGAQPDKIIREIRIMGAVPKYILLTHGHHDHIGAVKRLLSAFPDVSLHIGEGDLEMLGDTQKSLAVFRSEDDSQYIVGGAEGVGEGHSFQLGDLSVSVLDTPGHTKGGVSYLCMDAIFSGDTLFKGNAGRTDLYGGDYEVLLCSLSKLAALQGNYTIYPGHGDSSNLDYELRTNPYIKEAVK